MEGGENGSSLWSVSSPKPKLLGDVTGLLLVPASSPIGNKLLLTESLCKELCPVLCTEAQMEEGDRPAECWMHK